MGGTEDAATGILSNLIRPLSYHMPETKICEKLKAMDGQICELRYGNVQSTLVHPMLGRDVLG